MIEFIRALRQFLRLRKTPIGHVYEINRLLVKAGRRCAYDLRHASAEIPYSELMFGESTSNWYHNRANEWLKVFNPADDGKHYRDELHIEISNLESQVEKLIALCEENGIDASRFKPMPF